MTALREDDALELPSAPKAIPPLDAPHAGLALAGPAGPGSFLAEGERVSISGARGGAVGRVRVDGRTVVSDLRSDTGAVANVIAWPGALRRERIGAHGVTVEDVVAAPALPLAVVQWQPVGGGREPFPRVVSLELRAPADGGRFRVEPHAAAIAGPDGDLVAVALPPPGALRLVRAGPDALRLEARADAGGPLTLAISAASPRGVATAFAAAAHLTAHARAAREAAAPDGLTLASGVPELDEGMLWARSRLASGVAAWVAALRAEPRGRDEPVGAVGASSADPLWAALAAVAVGAERTARSVLEPVATRDPHAAALVAARVAMAFGDAGPALARARALAPGASDAGPRLLRTAAFAALADALHGSADEGTIGSLRAAASEASEPPGRGSARPLPMAGRAPAPDLGGWLPTLLAGRPSARIPDGRSSAEADLFALAAAFPADPDAAWAAWRGALAGGLRAGPAGVGTWDADPGALAESGVEHDPAGSLLPVTSSLLLAAAHGLLGLAPDAPSGRLSVAPRLPSHLASFRAEGIGVGSARLTLTYERDGATHRFGLEPTAGSVPPWIVFEPSVPSPVASALVDGGAADLETREEGARTTVRLQLPVDAPRTIEIVGR